jgi:hypothetical protein
VVFDQRTGRSCLLSNWHVLAGAEARPGDPVVQPGMSDAGRHPRHTIAHLERFHLGPKGDAAIAVFNGRRQLRADQFQTQVKIRAARMPRVGETLEKVGARTGVTHAKVGGKGRYKVPYQGVGRRAIDGFVLVPTRRGNPRNEEITEPGDSGAIWYDPRTQEGVGLHFAGETNRRPTDEHALACFLPSVLEELDVSLTPILVPGTGIAVEGLGELPVSEANVTEGLRPLVSTAANTLAVAEWVGANRERLRELEDLLKHRSVEDETHGSTVYTSHDGTLRIDLGSEAQGGVTIAWGRKPS